MRETKSLGLFRAFVSQNKILIENTFFVHNKLQGALYVEIYRNLKTRNALTNTSVSSII